MLLLISNNGLARELKPAPCSLHMNAPTLDGKVHVHCGTSIEYCGTIVKGTIVHSRSTQCQTPGERRQSCSLVKQPDV